MDKWLKRDKKLKDRRVLKSIRQVMSEKEPRKKKRRYKSRHDLADEEWRLTIPSSTEFEEFEDELNSEESYTITLSHNELLYLDDCLTLMIERVYENPMESGTHTSTMRNILPTAPLAVPIELVEKIGIGVLYVTDEDNDGKDAEIEFDVPELYMLREVTQSYVKVGKEPVGFNIKRKLYKAMHAKKYENIKQLDRIIADYNVTASPDKRISTVIDVKDSP